MRHLMMLGGVLLLMGALLFVGRAESGSSPDSFGSDSSVPRGNYQPAPQIPGTPITVLPGGSPLNDAPSVTIIRDVREKMKRLPDRETPRGWTLPKKKPG